MGCFSQCAKYFLCLFNFVFFVSIATYSVQRTYGESFTVVVITSSAKEPGPVSAFLASRSRL